MEVVMSSLPRFLRIGENRIPVELAKDPPFLFLVEAFEGRSKAALLHGQRVSTYRPRQRYLDLVRGRYPKADVNSLANTISAAVQLYDKIPSIQVTNFVFLDALLRFLKEYGLVTKEQFDTISEEIKARIKVNTGTFEAYLAEWNGKTQKDAFERQAIRSADLAERMYKNKKEALRRLARRETERAAEQQTQQERNAPPLGEKLKSRVPTVEDLARLCRDMCSWCCDMSANPV
jgi:hypothetical protein